MSNSIWGYIISWGTSSAIIICPLYFIYIVVMCFAKRAKEYKTSKNNKINLLIYVFLLLTVFLCSFMLHIFSAVGTFILHTKYYSLKIVLSVAVIVVLLLLKPFIEKLINRFITFIINISNDNDKINK